MGDLLPQKPYIPNFSFIQYDTLKNLYCQYVFTMISLQNCQHDEFLSNFYHFHPQNSRLVLLDIGPKLVSSVVTPNNQ